MKTITLVCVRCGKTYNRPVGEFNRNERSGHRNDWCSRACHQASIILPLKACQHCSKDFTPYRSGKFCSLSCSAKFNNAIRVKKQKDEQRIEPAPKCTKCRRCKKPHNDGRPSHRICDECHSRQRNWSTITIADYRKLKADVHSGIRGLARGIYAANTRTFKCALCDFDAHIDVCHIRAISDFPDHTTIAEINAPSNLIGLCPNHHWLQGHGHINV